MKNYRTTINIAGIEYQTLVDILPESGNLEILFIAKTPAPVSVTAGHYFQGKQGSMFWNKLSESNILKIPSGKYADECLLENGFGITDIVKLPRAYGNEPSEDEYLSGMERIFNIIKSHQPKVLIFVYKKVLDNIVRLSFGIKEKSQYGFNPKLEEFFHSKVFVFPMPGTPCTKATAELSMNELKNFLRK